LIQLIQPYAATASDGAELAHAARAIGILLAEVRDGCAMVR
jgi:hypothetical protein